MIINPPLSAMFESTVQESTFESSWELSEEADISPQHLDREDDTEGLAGDSDHESVNLTEDMREAIILTFPAYPICRPDCKGLCAMCGINLNNEACDCRAPQEDRWSTLDRLDIT